MNPKFPEPVFTRTQTRRKSADFRPTLFSLSLCLCASFVQSAHAQSQNQSADNILRAVKQSEDKIQYSATQVVQRGSDREVAKIYRSGPKRRLEWIAPSVRKGDVMVDDGTNVILYHRSDNSAVQTQSMRRNSNFSDGEWKVGPPVNQSGKLVRILSRANGRKITVDAQTKAIVRMVGPRGMTVLQNIQYGAIPAAKFNFSPPAGVQLQKVQGQLFNDLKAAQRRASWFKAPAQLPPGYTFESAVVGGSEVWLRYSDGRKRFSIFQQKADGGDMKPQPVNGGWFWKSGGLRFLATDAPENAIQSLASSLK